MDWLPYHLHPEYPADGIAREELVARYGDHFADTVRTLAEEAGLPFNPHPTRVPNTRRALELTEWARQQSPEAHEALHTRLMDAYWAEGRDLTHWSELASCLEDVGLDAGEAEIALENGSYGDPVDGWTSWAQSNGISAIPAFVFEERLLVSGAMPNEVLERAAREAREQRISAEAAD